MYLPSVKESIKRRICSLSQICSQGAAAIKRHRKGDGCTKRQSDGDEDIHGEDEEDEDIAIETVADERVTVSNLLEVLTQALFRENDWTLHSFIPWY